MDERRIGELAASAENLAATVPNTTKGDDVSRWMQGVRGLGSSLAEGGEERAWLRGKLLPEDLGPLETLIATLAAEQSGFNVERAERFKNLLTAIGKKLRGAEIDARAAGMLDRWDASIKPLLASWRSLSVGVVALRGQEAWELFEFHVRWDERPARAHPGPRAAVAKGEHVVAYTASLPLDEWPSLRIALRRGELPAKKWFDNDTPLSFRREHDGGTWQWHQPWWHKQNGVAREPDATAAHWRVDAGVARRVYEILDTATRERMEAQLRKAEYGSLDTLCQRVGAWEPASGDREYARADLVAPAPLLVTEARLLEDGRSLRVTIIARATADRKEGALSLEHRGKSKTVQLMDGAWTASPEADGSTRFELTYDLAPLGGLSRASVVYADQTVFEDNSFGRARGTRVAFAEKRRAVGGRGATTARRAHRKSGRVRAEPAPRQAKRRPGKGGSMQRQRVFIVHGHDVAMKEQVARFVERIGLKAVILHEQPSRGATIIEKLERHAAAAFAVVLLSPDDMAFKKGRPAKAKPRARQNVILELGIFIGRLRRDRVCVLRKKGVELPSDMHGVVHLVFNGIESVKNDLMREFKAAGLKFDANKAI